MRYPASLNSKLQELENIVQNWPVEKPFQEVLDWILQFDSEDFEIPFRIIKNINIIGVEDMKHALKVAYSKLERMASDKNASITHKNTLFAGVGEGGKSGSMMSYHFRVINDISEENFIGDDSIEHLENGRIKNIVLIDDIVSSGNQATEEIKIITEKFTPFGVENIFLLTSVGMKSGLEKIEEETKAFVFSAFEYDERDTVASLDAQFYDGLDVGQRSRLKTRIEYYGAKCCRSPLGYQGVGGLIHFYFNTPNSTLPIIWSMKNSWIPLFRRSTRINGIDSYYKQVDSALNKKIEGKTTKKTKANAEKEPFSIFVEGKSDEVFIRLVLDGEKSDVLNQYRIIVLGPMVSSNLADLLAASFPKHLFVLDDEDASGHRSFGRRLARVVTKFTTVKIKSFFNYIDLKRLVEDKEYSWIFKSRPLQPVELDDIPKHEREALYLEFMRGMPFSSRERVMEDLFRQYKLESEVNILKSELVGEIVKVSNPS